MLSEYSTWGIAPEKSQLERLGPFGSRVAAITAAMVVLTAPAIADAQTAQDESLSQVTIQAGRNVHRQQVGTTYTGIPVELVQLTRRVGYSDLDLSNAAGADELRGRVQDTAHEACRQLDQLYPLDVPEAGDDAQCVSQAVDGAMPQVRAAIVAVYGPEIGVDNAVVALGRLRKDPGFSQALQHAKGILIVPHFVKVAAIVGGQGGDGVLLVRQHRGWSNPAFYEIGGGSIGLQAGAAGGPVALLLMNDKAVKVFETQASTWNLDSSAGLTVVNYSASASASSAKGDVILWTDTKGLFAGAGVGIRNIRRDESADRAYYDQPMLTSAQILNEEISNPHQSNAKLLRDVLPVRLASR